MLIYCKTIELEIKQINNKGIVYRPKFDPIFDLAWYAFVLKAYGIEPKTIVEKGNQLSLEMQKYGF